MKIKELCSGISYQVLQGSEETQIGEVVYDSRQVKEGDLFLCIPGAVVDGHKYAAQAAQAKAAAIVVEREVKVPEGVTVILVEDSRKALAGISAAFFGHPAEELITIGITGTKGKTTTTYMIRSILEAAGIKTGLIGTIETIIGETHIPAKNTTPESYVVQKTFREMADAGIKCVVMEVSSQGLMLSRVGGFLFDYGIFTNLSEDHIGPNEHKDFADYLRCKSMLFRQCRIGIVNADDEYAGKILEGHTCTVETYGFHEDAALRASDLSLVSRPGFFGVSYQLSCDGRKTKMEIDFPGRFSVYNSLAAVAICRHFDIGEEKIKEVLAHVKVKGRVELLKVSDRYTLMIDYAHNAMALESLLTTLREYQPKRLVCLFGCGGSRSKLRRFEMGEVSSNLADLTVVTSDNPRDEEPGAIMEDIITGVKKGSGEYIAIEDRKEAIRYCMEHAEEGDVIVLAGKGHEDYQEIHGKKYPMDERVLVQEILKEMKQEKACNSQI